MRLNLFTRTKEIHYPSSFDVYTSTRELILALTNICSDVWSIYEFLFMDVFFRQFIRAFAGTPEPVVIRQEVSDFLRHEDLSSGFSRRSEATDADEISEAYMAFVEGKASYFEKKQQLQAVTTRCQKISDQLNQTMERLERLERNAECVVGSPDSLDWCSHWEIMDESISFEASKPKIILSYLVCGQWGACKSLSGWLETYFNRQATS